MHRILGFALVWTCVLTASSRGATQTVNTVSGTIQWPTPNPAAPPANGTTISTGGNLSLPLFNPTLGFLTKVDLSFDFSTLYGGSIYNGGTAPYEGSILSSSGTTVRYDMAPFGNLWTFAAPAEGPTTADYVPVFRTSFNRSSPTRGHASPTVTFTKQGDLNQFVGIGATRNITAQQSYLVNLSLSPQQSGARVATFQRAFAPRAKATYTYSPFAQPLEGDGGLSFSLAEGPITATGQGQVQPTPLGAQHHLAADSTGSSSPVVHSTSIRQMFQFNRQDQGGEPTFVFVNGLVEGSLGADRGGRAQAMGIIELFNLDGQMIDRAERLVFADSMSENNSAISLEVLDRFGLTTQLIPGSIYELRTSLELTADPRGVGWALADFSDTFEVEVSGVPLPSPSAVPILMIALAAMRLRDRRRS